MKRRITSGAPWEDKVGYCRALRVGGRVFITGTAAVEEDGSAFAPGQPYEQAQRCLQLIEAALLEAGGVRSDIVRTRMFVTDIELWEDYGRAHSEFFGTERPTTTMVEVNRLIDPDMLIEIEADAIIEE